MNRSIEPGARKAARQARPTVAPASLLKLKLALLAPLTSFALLASPAGTYAQAAATGGISGRVLNTETGSYLNNARVRVSGTSIETFTNEFGEFRLDGLQAGSVTLEVFYTGFPVKNTPVVVTAGTVTEQTISVTVESAADDEGIVELEVFLVQTKRETNAQSLALNEQRFSANLKNVVSTDAFGDVGQGNIGEFMKHIPGVTVEYGNAGTVSGVQIRGFNSNYTSVTLDGGAMASAAGTGTQNHSRQFGLEQASINNISRIEVTKLPTPENSANSMGGSVNMVSKNAFEKVQPELRFSAYLSMNSYDTQLEKTAGPEDEKSYKVRPSFDLSYTLPINKKFGVVLTASSANQFSRNYSATPSRSYITTGPSSARVLTGVYTSQVAVGDAPALSDRNSMGLRFDWKPAEGQTLSLTGQANAFSGFSGRRGLTLNPGGSPVAYGESFTYGAVNAGTVSQSTGYQDRNGLTHVLGLRYQFARGAWQADASAAVSTSTNKTRDTDKGFFNTVGTRTPAGTVKVDISGMHNGEGAASGYSVTDSLGNPVDFTKLANSRITQATSERIDAEDTVKDFKVNVRRDLDFLPFNLAVKGGANIYSLRREIDFTSKTWTYVGPDGVANTADDTAAAYVDTDYSVNTPGYTYPAVEWVSPWKVFQAYLNNPQYFTRSAGQINDTIRNEAVRSPILEETITSGYLMGDLKMFDNRLRLLGGVRYELTEDEGLGYKQTATGYEKRGFFNSRDYDGFYPSVHGTFNITENLLLRAGFAKTMGRPPISDIVPNIYVAANTGTGPELGWVVASNSTLRPWSAKNYDITLEYYLPFNGVASAGVFRKDIRDQFGSLGTKVDEALAAELGLGSETIGYEYSTRINSGNSRITGAEFGYSQSLAVLGSWAKPFSLFSNFTVLDVDGKSQGDFRDFVPKSANLGGSLSYKRVYFLAKANYRGRALREMKNSTFLGAGEFIRERTTIDLNLDVTLTRRFALFTTVRNLTNEPYQTELDGPNLPGWATLTQDTRSGAQYTLGVKGNF